MRAGVSKSLTNSATGGSARSLILSKPIGEGMSVSPDGSDSLKNPILSRLRQSGYSVQV